MYRFAIIFVLFCCSVAPPGLAQLSTNRLTPGNVNAVLAEIEHNYANRIDIPMTKVAHFLQGIDAFPYQSSLAVPQAAVVEESDPLLRIDWPQLPGAQAYHIRYLHLGNGQTDSQWLHTSEYALYNWDNGLTLYLVSARFGNKTSAEFIIIDEKIIAFDVSNVHDCHCSQFEVLYFEQFYGTSIGARVSSIIQNEEFEHNSLYRVKWGFDFEAGSQGKLFDTNGQFFMGYQDLVEYQRIILLGNALGNCFENTHFADNEDQIYALDESGAGFLAFSYAPYTGFTMDWLAETQGGYLHISKCTDRSSRRSAQVASESNNNTQLQLSPNPAREALYLQMTGAKAGAALRLQLFDAQGRARALPTPLPATTTGTFQYRLDLDQLPTGWYFGRLQVGAHYETFRFLKVE